MIPNTNPDTGLPYGVINGHSLEDELFLELLDKARNVVYQELRAEFMATLTSDILDSIGDHVHTGIKDLVHDLVESVADKAECDGAFDADEASATFEHEGVQVHFGWLGGAPIVTSINGPLTQVRSYCSPCVPNAADLDSGYGSITCHGFPIDWYSEEAWAKLTSGDESEDQ